MKYMGTNSVLRIRDVFPGSRILTFTHPGSRIPDPGSKNSSKREGWKKISCHTFFCSHKCHIIEHYFIFKKLKKKIWASFQGTRSGIRKKPIPDPGSRGKKTPDPGSRIRNTVYHMLWCCRRDLSRCRTKWRGPAWTRWGAPWTFSTLTTQP